MMISTDRTIRGQYPDKLNYLYEFYESQVAGPNDNKCESGTVREVWVGAA